MFYIYHVHVYLIRETVTDAISLVYTQIIIIFCSVMNIIIVCYQGTILHSRYSRSIIWKKKKKKCDRTVWKLCVYNIICFKKKKKMYKLYNVLILISVWHLFGNNKTLYISMFYVRCDFFFITMIIYEDFGFVPKSILILVFSII